MKPFDLAKAKAGAPVQTRDGKPVRIICFDKKSDSGKYPIVALRDLGHREGFILSRTDGRAFDKVVDDNDLVMTPVQREGWVNVYSNNYCDVFTGLCVYNTEAEGRSGRNDNSNYLATVKITWEE